MAAENLKFDLPNDSLSEIQKIVNTIKEGFKEILEPLNEIKDVLKEAFKPQPLKDFVSTMSDVGGAVAGIAVAAAITGALALIGVSLPVGAVAAIAAGIVLLVTAIMGLLNFSDMLRNSPKIY